MRTGTLLNVLILAIIVWGCEQPQDVPAVAHDDTITVAHDPLVEHHFRCGDALTFAVEFASDTAHVRLPESDLTLPQQVAASGARYGADGYELHVQGGEAIFTTPDATYRDCARQVEASVWDEARQRGITFRAVGQEPGWMLEVHNEDRIELLINYGEDVFEADDVAREDRRNGYILRAVSTRGDIIVHVDEESCIDVMSGERFEARVTVVVGREELKGCGRELD
jgi:uncharacterized membrane protein/membrane-bound inhibitor of C-type lysozyme